MDCGPQAEAGSGSGCTPLEDDYAFVMCGMTTGTGARMHALQAAPAGGLAMPRALGRACNQSCGDSGHACDRETNIPEPLFSMRMRSGAVAEGG